MFEYLQNHVNKLGEIVNNKSVEEMTSFKIKIFDVCANINKIKNFHLKMYIG